MGELLSLPSDVRYVTLVGRFKRTVLHWAQAKAVKHPGGMLPGAYLHLGDENELSNALMFQLPGEMVLAQVAVEVTRAQNRIIPLELATSISQSAQTVSAALGHTAMSGASPMHVDSVGAGGSPPVAGNDADDKWRHDAAALLSQAADPGQFGKVLGKVLPEAAAACMQSQVALGKGPVKDRVGNTQQSYMNRSFDAIYALQADPKVPMTSAGVGPAMAHYMKGVDETEALVKMLENRNGKGEVQGIGDAAGRALMAGTLLLEF
jgi:hypothetical protein